MSIRFATAAVVFLLCLQPLAAAERYAATGMVLEVDAAHLTFVASIEAIKDFMPAMTMPFQVKDSKQLAGLAPGAIVDFTVVVDKTASYVEGIRVRRYQNIEQDPLAARRLSLLKELAGGATPKALAIGAAVPDFTLTDQKYRRIALSQFRGKVVAINFMYTT